MLDMLERLCLISLLIQVLHSSLFGDNYKFLIMIAVSLFFMYLAIAKKFEPLLLLPISFGMLLANLPNSGLMAEPVKELINVIGVDPSSQMPYLAQVSGDTTSNGGLLWYIFQGDE